MKLSLLFVISAFVVIMGGCDSNDAGQASKNENLAQPQPKADGPTISASSQTAELGPAGLMQATKPGWHSDQPPKFPEYITVDLHASKAVGTVGLLQQEGQPKRGPKALRIEVSSDGNEWTPVAGADDACQPNAKDGWTDVTLSKPATARYVKVVVFSNCGDPHLLTIRGLRIS
ncbi:discoidin domain-containing protein [Chitinivorax sp. B]|uniref:discoidin domain-containing protein n=1 Tax=Chitinivorax sp. B TaxID=2502235 RepID=UPI0010F476A5|nr:discoidin domain-containing protein [Chitinivorax sp. B]